MPLNPSRLRLITRIFLALLLTLSAMSAGVFWLLQRNPQALTEHYIEQIAASTGLTITVESVNVALLPLPSLAVSNASITGKGLSFTVAYATLRPDFLALLRGELLPRNITLLRPQFQGQVPVALANSFLFPQDTLADAAPAQDSAAPSADSASGETSLQTWIAQLASGTDAQTTLLPGRFRLAISQGEVNLTGTDQASLTATGLQCDIESAEATRLQGNLFCATAILQPEGKTPARLDHLNIEGKTNISAPLSQTPQ